MNQTLISPACLQGESCELQGLLLSAHATADSLRFAVHEHFEDPFIAPFLPPKEGH